LSRRATDGLLGYHDKKAALVAAKRSQNSDVRAGWFGFIDLLVGGVLT